MKNHILLYLYVVIFLASCSATNRLTLNAKQPALVYIPKEVQRIGIINRSLPLEQNKPLDQIDKFISAEGLNLDEIGAQSEIEALKNFLETNGKYDKVTLLNTPNEIRKGFGVLPATLSWETVTSICKTNNVDVLFVLSCYDTDTKVSYAMTTTELPNPIGIKIAIPEHEVSLNTLIKSGWRVYDPWTKTVLDEYLFHENIVSIGKGINPVKAIEAISNRNEMVIEKSKDMGVYYSSRFFPYTTRVSREYYVRGTENFELAMRRAQTGNWDGAAELWKKELTNTKSKIAGRACYNMAISNEINGDLTTAITWASKSYEDYKNRDALDYISILKYRQSKTILLKEQQ